jgi:Mg/Co/Ni transporter MgtE
LQELVCSALGLGEYADKGPMKITAAESSTGLMIGGVFADRRDRRHMILMSQIIQMLVALVLAVLIYTRRIQVAYSFRIR